MIGFLIFYFVFSAIFAVGVLACDKDDIPLDEFMMSILLGWLLLPFGLGMLVSHIINGKRDE
jgi:ACR3 family arsenite efflux pump ArsB